jgi:hypothetical protein
MSYIQSLVKKQIQEWFPGKEIIENYRPNWLIGLEIDLYLPEYNLAIEVNGLQHYIKIDKFFKSNYLFEMQVIRDYVKERIIKNEKIAFIKIRQGYNLLNGLKKQLDKTLNKEFEININLKQECENHWLKNKSSFLEGKSNPSFVKITFLKKEKKYYEQLFLEKKYSEAFAYIKTHAHFK